MVLPVGRASALAREATVAALCFQEPKQICNGAVELGFPHRAESYRAKESSRSSVGCRSCRDLEGLLIRRWDCVLPGCGGNLALARLVTLAARWLQELQSTSNLPVGLGSPHRTGRYYP